MSEPTLRDATKAVSDASKALVAEYRSQLAEARAHCITIAQQLSARTELAAALAKELDATRIELARKDERIAELERQLEVAAWRERLGGL